MRHTESRKSFEKCCAYTAKVGLESCMSLAVRYREEVILQKTIHEINNCIIYVSVNNKLLYLLIDLPT